MCMCGALRRVVICFGWSGVEENRQPGCGKRRDALRIWRVHERIEEDEGARYGSYRGGADAESEERFLASLPAQAGSE